MKTLTKKRDRPPLRSKKTVKKKAIKRSLGMNITSDHINSLENLDKEDLLKMVRTMVSGGIVLNFHGKRTAQEIDKKVRPRQTQIIKKLCVGNPEEQAKNMIIEGENLQAMVTLYKERGQVDLILTDPPYNTGQYFRYNDSWDTDPNDPELGQLVKMEDGSRHTKWMKAMLPRLNMMKAMLKPNGVLAVCIDENELFHLGMMLDEIFGEENRIAIINWQKSYSPKNSNNHVSTSAEYVLVYANDKSISKTSLLPRTEEMDRRYKSIDGDPHPWKNADSTATDIEKTHGSLIFGIQQPITGEIVYPSKGRCWCNERKKLKSFLEEWGSKYESRKINDGLEKALVIKGAPVPGEKEYSANNSIIKKTRQKALARHEKGVWPEMYFGTKGVGKPAFKRYLSNVKRGIIPMTYWADEEYDEPLVLGAQSWDHEQSGHSQAGVNELSTIVGKGHGFDTVKPLKLFKKIIQIWCPPNGLVLDPYAGSGTTGHAILELNHKTGDDRRFILIEQGAPEKGDKYARSLTQERLRRVITGKRPDAKVSAKPIKSGFQFRMLTKKIDSKTVLTMRKDELIDVVITSHWENDRRGGSGLIRIDDEKYKYLVGRNEENEGYFLIWNGEDKIGQLDAKSYSAIIKEGKKAELKQPYHVYARYEIYQSKHVIFYKIPDKILAHLGLNENNDRYNEEEE